MCNTVRKKRHILSLKTYLFVAFGWVAFTNQAVIIIKQKEFSKKRNNAIKEHMNGKIYRAVAKTLDMPVSTAGSITQDKIP